MSGQYRHWVITQHRSKQYQNDQDTPGWGLWPHAGETAEDLAQTDAKKLIENLPNLRFAQFQIERGEDKKALTNELGSLHLQAYIEFSKPYRFAAVVKMFPVIFDSIATKGLKASRWTFPHVERREHSRKAAREYCMKTDSRAFGCEPLQVGEWRPDAKRETSKKDGIAKVGDLLNQGWDYFRFAADRPDLFLRYGKRINECIHARTVHANRILSQQIEDEQSDEEE